MKKSLSVLAVLVFVAITFVVYMAYEAANVHYGGVELPSENTAGGKTGVGVIIEYADGRIQEVNPVQIKYSLFPLTVYCGGEPVKRFTWVAYLYLDWQGDLTCLEIKGSITVKSGDIVIRKEGIWRKTGVNFNMPQKKQYVEIWRFSVDALDVEASIGTSGAFKLTCTVEVTATATFSSGVMDAASGSASTNIDVTVQAGALTAMLVDVQASALRS